MNNCINNKGHQYYLPYPGAFREIEINCIWTGKPCAETCVEKCEYYTTGLRYSFRKYFKKLFRNSNKK